MINAPFAYSSNGDGFIEHDRTKTEGRLERTLGMNEFPSPQELWEHYEVWKQIKPEEEAVINQPYYIGDKPPNYYQKVAIHTRYLFYYLLAIKQSVFDEITRGGAQPY